MPRRSGASIGSPNCEEVVIFGDNDPLLGGKAAAYRLANRLAVKRSPVAVRMAPEPGRDWNDILRNRRARK